MVPPKEASEVQTWCSFLESVACVSWGSTMNPPISHPPSMDVTRLRSGPTGQPLVRVDQAEGRRVSGCETHEI